MSAFHQLCQRYCGTLIPTAPRAVRLWETFTFLFFIQLRTTSGFLPTLNIPQVYSSDVIGHNLS